jgi:hypothetical protein
MPDILLNIALVINFTLMGKAGFWFATQKYGFTLFLPLGSYFFSELLIGFDGLFFGWKR